MHVNVDPTLSLERAVSLPARCYTDEAYFAQECEQVFFNSWQYFGNALQLPEKGDTLCGEIAGRPLIAVRGDQGRIEVFYNVCRHRGGPLETCPSNRRILRCRYHGWSYTLDGQLVGAPRFQGAEDFSTQALRLQGVASFVWQGLIFVHLGAEPDSAPLLQTLRHIEEMIAPATMPTQIFTKRRFYDIDCNWKVYLDNYLEGYHIPYIHPELNTMLNADRYDIVLGTDFSLQTSPIENNAGVYGQTAGRAYYFFVFPNIMFNLVPGRLQMNAVLPLGKDKTRVIYDFSYNTSLQENLAEISSKDEEYSDLVQNQDVGICLDVQKALASGVYTPGRLSPQEEKAVWHFHNLLREAYLEKTQTF